MKNRIKASLPNFPDCVIENWLLPFAEDIGWPPKELDGFLIDRWRDLLGQRTDLEYWKNVKWKLIEMEIIPPDFESESKDKIEKIIEFCVFDRPNWLSDAIPSMKRRFDSLVRYIKENGVYPIPPVIIDKKEGLCLIDGNHRLSAYYYCAGLLTKVPEEMVRNSTPKNQKYWIGLCPNKAMKRNLK